MTITDYLIFLALLVTTCAILDRAWLDFVRPWLTGRKALDSERIKPKAWVGVLAVLFVIFASIPLMTRAVATTAF